MATGLQHLAVATAGLHTGSPAMCRSPRVQRQIQCYWAYGTSGFRGLLQSTFPEVRSGQPSGGGKCIQYGILSCMLTGVMKIGVGCLQCTWLAQDSMPVSAADIYDPMHVSCTQLLLHLLVCHASRERLTVTWCLQLLLKSPLLEISNYLNH